MSTPELVTLTIDGREVSVPKGTGLVEAALAAGIEIPVFCYEPRLGPPVGACRMCLCEVAPGPPKPQAACTLTAAEGMTVKTAATSEMAAESQNATLEFILVNHPLDCPVCDKGGECPLQDLTFRYGPGSTRMNFDKRTFEKPIPISPTIALDRERCILCYRCTRFSESVAEDGQLVAVERGSASMIATFGDEPYAAPFSGNVIELCPVGALTSTKYRFEARPWEIQNVPTVCGLCPVGCNISATTREGKIKRILSRNHPEIDEGWLCDKGRFAYSHLQAGDRIQDPLQKNADGRFEALEWNTALDRAEELLRKAGPAIVTALSGSETVEQAYGLGKLLRSGLGAHEAVLPEEIPDGLDSFRAPLSSIRNAGTVVVLCSEPVVGAGPDRRPLDQGRAAERRFHRHRAARRAGRQRSPDQRRRRDRGLDRTGVEGNCCLLPPAHSQRARRHRCVELRGRRRGRGPRAGAGDHLGRRGCRRPRRQGAREARAARNRDRHVRGVVRRARRVSSFPARATSSATARRSTWRVGSSASAARSSHRAPTSSRGSRSLRSASASSSRPHASVAFEEISKRCYGGISFGAVGEQAPLPQPVTATGEIAKPADKPRTHGKGLRLVSYRPLFSGPAVDRTPELEFHRREGEVELAPADARKRKIAAGDEVTVSSNGTSRRLRARIARDLPAGAVRVTKTDAEGLHDHVEVAK